MHSDSAPKKHQVDRRTVVKGAAWSVPVVAVATSVPAAAASLDLRPNLAITAGPVSSPAARSSAVGFTVQSVGSALDRPLELTQRLVYRGEFTWAAGLESTSRTAAQLVGNGVLASYLATVLPANVGSSLVTFGNWNVLSGATYNEGTTSKVTNGIRTTSFTLTYSRSGVVAVLPANGSTSVTYAASAPLPRSFDAVDNILSVDPSQSSSPKNSANLTAALLRG